MPAPTAASTHDAAAATTAAGLARLPLRLTGRLGGLGALLLGCGLAQGLVGLWPALAGEALPGGALLSAGLLAVMLPGWLAVAWVLRDALRRLEAIRRFVPTGAEGSAGTVPHTGDADEIGAFARGQATLAQAASQARLLTEELRASRTTAERQYAAIDQHTQGFGASVSGVITSLAFSVDTMQSFAGELSSAAAGTETQARQTSETAVESSAQLEEVAAAVEQISASVNEIAGRVAAAVQETRRAVACTTASDAAVQSLAEGAGRIGAIADLIRDVAARTNLLALNATIEAARAGEAGKGFAVVAGEVKALATQTARATEEINQQIAAIRHSTQGVVEAMRDVGGTTRRIDEAASAIAAAVEQQGATAREIAVKVQAVSAATRQAAEAMSEVTGATNQAQMTSAVVLDAASDVGRQAHALREEVDDFLAAIRADGGNRRNYERLPLQGVKVGVELPEGLRPAEAIDISRGGVAVRLQAEVDAGTLLAVMLPGEAAPVAARVVRADDGMLAVSFRQDAETLARVEQVIDRLRGAGRIAA